MDKDERFVFTVILGVTVGYYAGGMFDFFPFYANDFVVKAVGFCTLITCTVVAICTCIIVNKLKKQ